MKTIVCPVCQKNFQSKHWRAKYCSKACKTQADIAVLSAKRKVDHAERSCELCGKIFKPNRVDQRCCCSEHNRLLQEEKRLADPVKRQKKLENLKRWREANKKARTEYMKQYAETNKDSLKAKRKQKYAIRTPQQVARNQEYQRRWCENNRGYHNEKQKQRRITKPWESGLRDSIRYALGRQQIVKSKRTENLLGCTIEEAKAHLASLFAEGMCWDNYGEWHIDHIRPCASFDLSDSEQQKQCCHYTNLQPLWAADNLAKSDKWEAA